MNEMSGLDASFLYLETPSTPMNNGLVLVFDDAIDFGKLRMLLAERVRLIPSMIQRLEVIADNLDKPVWIVDPDFDLHNHLRRIRLHAPGNWDQIRRLASKFIAEPLDRSHPLWEMLFVEGVNQLSFAPAGATVLIIKVHHAAADGVSGSEILTMLFSESPEGKDVSHLNPFEPEEPPSHVGKLIQGGKHLAKLPLHAASAVRGAAVTGSKDAYITARVTGGKTPTLPLISAPPTILNAHVEAGRRWDGILLSLDRLKVMKDAAGVKVNDVALAIGSGALRRYLLAKDALPDSPLVTTVPVSLHRPGEDDDGAGNAITFMFVPLATDVADPMERLQAIYRNSQKEKAFLMAIDANTAPSFLELIPFRMAERAVRVYTKTGVTDYMRPLYNAVITNVPGPQQPIYLAGKRLLALFGMAPNFDGLGMTMTIFSYNGIIGFAPLMAENLVSKADMELFLQALIDSSLELEELLIDDNDSGAVLLFNPLADGGTSDTEGHRCWHTERSGQRCTNTVPFGAAFCPEHQPVA